MIATMELTKMIKQWIIKILDNRIAQKRQQVLRLRWEKARLQQELKKRQQAKSKEK